MKKYLFLFFILCSFVAVNAQRNIIDKVVAVVGDQSIYKSDIEINILQGKNQGVISDIENYKISVLENLLVRKLLLAQAKVDSIAVTDAEVERAVSGQIDNMISQIGSKERLEAYLGKKVDNIMSEWTPIIRERLITENMQQHIVKKIRITPSDIKMFYRRLSKDSLPQIPDKFELQQIVLKPKITDQEKERVREKLRQFRKDILSGEKTFSSLAVLYSDDLVSSAKGGELGYMKKNEFVSEFADAAFNLKPGKISKIVETEFGFHIIQLIDKKGERINCRHILLRPKVSYEAREETLHALDTIRNHILEGKISFEEAAFYYSSDKDTRNNGGLIVNQEASSRIARSEIKGEMARVVNNMNLGEISKPFTTMDMDREEFKIVKLKDFFKTHIANLDQDWMYFENMYRMKRQNEVLSKWIKEKRVSTYVHIDKDYMDDKFINEGWIK